MTITTDHELELDLRHLFEAQARSVQTTPRGATPADLGPRPVVARGPGRRRLVGAAAAAVIVLLGAGLALSARGDDQPRVEATSSLPSGTTGPDAWDCLPVPSHYGCEVTADQAAGLLGFVVPTPSRPPEGWVVDSFAVVEFLPHTPDNPFDVSSAMSRQVWQPPGTDRSNDRSAWASLDVRRALPADSASHFGPVAFSLDDGTPVKGASGLGNLGTHPETDPMVVLTNFFWMRNGLWYRFEAHVLPTSDAEALVRSLSG